ncbi:VIT1/CCC1 transporter family protein [Raineyella sp. W15-4]|uniref:VIT1/CCC1 transporter family protein n=1 Tax=Raineyella sp. W15-4 TaxID=3081651 RepID=UPI002953F936|nr:VIT1/CCC1 transporter family protein [Raineyella sp. W15-4]WOQ16865.1 VIT1/CCC1 transporter family protein [Raineyella sp. W15-4]
MSPGTGWRAALDVRSWVGEAWVGDANDGIIATAGLLEGLAGAGASDAVLVLAATVGTIAGGLGVAGARWAEAAAEREAEAAVIAEERAQLAAAPDDELAELAAYWEDKGLTPDVARQVAEQLSARDALAAQLAYEHGITAPTAPSAPVGAGLAAGLAFLAGAMVPLLITVSVPVSVESWLILVAVVLSLLLTSVVAARQGHLSVVRTIVRTLVVGVGTLAVSYGAGLLLW